MHLSDTIQRRRFVWLLPAVLALVTLGDAMFWQLDRQGGYIGIFLAAVLLVAVALRPAMWRDRRSWAAVTAALLFAVAYVRAPGPLAWWLFWAAAGTAVLMPATARFDDGWRWFQRLALHGLRALIAPLLDLRRFLKVRRGRPRGRFGVARSVAVTALPLGGSILILLLFAAANPILERTLHSLTSLDLSSLHPGRLILWAALATMAWSLLHPRPTQRLLGTFDGTGDLPLPGVSVASVTLSLIAFNLLFAVQNAMDLAYLGGLIALPEGITLAEYAHRGAYPLIATALLAALFVLVTLRPGSRTAAPRLIRRLVIVWIAQNVILVVSSIVRTLDYIDAFLLTELRIAALAWMALVALGLIFICWRMLHGRSASWLININLVAAGLVLTAFTLIDTAAIAATWNVRHARDVGGHGATLDLCYLNRRGASALPALIELEARPDIPPALRDRVRAIRGDVLDRLDRQIRDGGWSWRDAAYLAEAKAALARLPGPEAPRPGQRFCDGRLVPPPPRIAPAAPPATPSPTPAAALTRKALR